MTTTIIFAAQWLCSGVLLAISSLMDWAGYDWLAVRRQNRHHARQHHATELARIDQQTDVSVQRIATAFHAAQQRVREEAALVDEWRAIIRPWPEHTETDHQVTTREGQPA
ncbi:hypothetical protein [Mycobacteroides abscessus]|uniref:hypothetical protein n=1 Tax=Mycobacteroides abscessus TaxID=36809 RepID=UPI0009CE9619|nr:hypothetical protein [Mycobacteroides abscessus]SLB64778.1 Uncharacterised protein [Mycobacteroides abscessus subsp. abscessus]